MNIDENLEQTKAALKKDLAAVTLPIPLLQKGRVSHQLI
jgi:hypothetical protein